MATYSDVQQNQALQQQAAQQGGQTPFTAEKALGMNQQQLQAQQQVTQQAIQGQPMAAPQGQGGYAQGGPQQQMDPQMQQQIVQIAQGIMSGQIGEQELQQMPPQLAQAAVGLVRQEQAKRQQQQPQGLGGGAPMQGQPMGAPAVA